MSELQEEYGERVDFTIVPPEETHPGEGAPSHPDLEQYELGSHGLVAFASDGTVHATLPGHQFGREEIEPIVRALIDGG